MIITPGIGAIIAAIVSAIASVGIGVGTTLDANIRSGIISNNQSVNSLIQELLNKYMFSDHKNKLNDINLANLYKHNSVMNFATIANVASKHKVSNEDILNTLSRSTQLRDLMSNKSTDRSAIKLLGESLIKARKENLITRDKYIKLTDNLRINSQYVKDKYVVYKGSTYEDHGKLINRFPHLKKLQLEEAEDAVMKMFNLQMYDTGDMDAHRKAWDWYKHKIDPDTHVRDNDIASQKRLIDNFGGNSFYRNHSKRRAISRGITARKEMSQAMNQVDLAITNAIRDSKKKEDELIENKVTKMNQSIPRSVLGSRYGYKSITEEHGIGKEDNVR